MYEALIERGAIWIILIGLTFFAFIAWTARPIKCPKCGGNAWGVFGGTKYVTYECKVCKLFHVTKVNSREIDHTRGSGK